MVDIILITELNRDNIDVPRLIRIVVDGKPIKYLGFIPGGFDRIGLFEDFTKHGDNFCHILTKKGVISQILPVISTNYGEIALREGSGSHLHLSEYINAPNRQGWTPAHLAVYQQDPLALQTLYRCGADLTTSIPPEVLAVAHHQNTVRKYSPVQFIFADDDATAEIFLRKAIERKCKDLLHVIFEDSFSNVLALNPENTAVHSQIMRVLSLVGNNHIAISLKEWTSLLNSNATQKDCKNHAEIKKHILHKCADKYMAQFGKVAKFTITIQDLLNLGAIENDKAIELEKFINEGPTAYASSKEEISSSTSSALSAVQQPDVSSAVTKVEQNIRELAVDRVKYQSKLIDAAVLRTPASTATLAGVDLNKANTNGATQAAHAELEENELEDKENAGASGSLQSSLSVAQALAPKTLVLKESTKVNQQVKASSSKAAYVSSSSSSSHASESVNESGDIKIYAAQVTKCLKSAPNIVGYLESELGKNYTELHAFVTMDAGNGKVFEKVLSIAAKQLKTIPLNTETFFKKYIKNLTAQDLSALNKQKDGTSYDSYDLACTRDHLSIAKLLLEEGVELGCYSETTNSIFETPIKFGSREIIKYLLTEQTAITLDWFYILRKAIKYANLDVIQHYVDSEGPIVESTTDRKGREESGKYTILNYGLDSLSELLELRRYQTEQQQKDAITKINKLSQVLDLLIKNGKIYYSTEQDVLAKTISLIKHISQGIEILQGLDLTIVNNSTVMSQLQGLKDSLVQHYMTLDIPPASRQKLQKIEANVDDSDAASHVTDVSHFSVLSTIGEADSNVQSLGQHGVASSDDPYGT